MYCSNFLFLFFFFQNQLIGVSSRSLGQLSASSNISNLTAMSHPMSHSRESHSVSGHLNISNLGSSSLNVRESGHSSNHINLANLVNNAARDNVISSLPSIANLMASQLPQFSNSRPSTASQIGLNSSRKSSQPSIAGGSTSSANLVNESSSILNLSDVQGRSHVNLSSSPHNHSTNNTSTTPSQRSITSGMVKRESPLDLSVKTVRQSADSTAADEEYMNLIYSRNSDYFQSKTPPKSSLFPSNSSPFDASRSNNKPVSAPKVDFTPDFSATAHIVPKKKKALENQQYANSLPSIGSFAKPQMPRSRADPYPYYQSGPSTSNVSLTQSQQAVADLPKSVSSFPAAVKRPGENSIPAVAPKIPRTDDTWRQTIDRQIENKLNSYLSSKTVNGDRPFESSQNFRYPQCSQYSTKPLDKPVVNGQANKQVLNILRTSLETREARNKAVPSSSPSPVAERSLPKIPVLPPPAPSPARQNLPPFGAIGTYPKESPVVEAKTVEIVDITDDNDENESKKPTTNGNASNGELDGLAAFLAARIRTKAELKQVNSLYIVLHPSVTSLILLGE